MHLSKLVKTLRLLDKPTMKKLGDYLHSPYFKAPDAVVDLFNYVQPLHPVFPGQKMLPRAISAAAASLRHTKTQSNVAALLLQQVDRFMAFENVQKNISALHFHSLREFKERNLTPLYKELWQHATEKNTALQQPPHVVYWYQHLFTELQYSGLDAKLKREEDNDLSPLVASLDVFYALKKLFYLTEMQLRHFQFGTPQPVHDTAALLQILQPITVKKNPLVFLTVHSYLMVNAPGFEAGEAHLRHLQQLANSVTAADYRLTLIPVVNFAERWCTRWLNRGYKNVIEYHFWCIDYKMKHGLLLRHEIILPTDFCNLLILAYHAQKPPAWVNEFIEKYSPLLPPDEREVSVAFGKGLYYYAQKDYTNAIRCYVQAQVKTDAVFNALMRRWEFVARYEDPDSSLDEQLNHLDSFKRYLHRHAVRLQHVKPGFEKFIYYCGELLLNPSYAKAEKLYKQVQREAHFPGKEWVSAQWLKKQKPVRAGTG